MTGILQAILMGYGAAAAAVTDAYFYLVTLLLPGNGTNGAQNNTFLDSSSNNFTITRNGNTTQGTFSPFSQTGWSGNFNTSTTYLTVTDTANLRFGSGNFTIEAWVYRSASGAVQTIASKGASTPTGWVFQISAADKLVFTDTSTSITGATTLNANTWYYVAVVRAGTGTNQTTLYVNATSDATGTSATNFNQTTNMLIGADRSTANFANGYISNLRLSNTNRTISSTPTSPLSADANTIFLSLGFNRFQYTDSGGTYTSMTVTGTPSIQPFEPFAPGAAYSATNVGGSGYFDGTGDFLSLASNTLLDPGAGDFTIEAWIYTTTSTVTAEQTIIAYGIASGNLRFQVNNIRDLRVLDGASAIATGTSSIIPFSWNHVAVVRSGSATNNVKLYVNGAQVAQGTNTTTFTGTANIGDNSSRGLYGYMTSFRFVKAQALTSGAFTPPTAPVTTSAVGWTGANAATSITGAVNLLLNYTNAGITDATAKNVLETAGSAQISTAQSKFGGSSMLFDGTAPADYLRIPSSPITSLGSGSWTIEFWVYRVGSGNQIFYDQRSAATQVAVTIFNDGTNILRFFVNGANVISDTTTFPSSTWTHVAVCKSGSSTRMFVNGTQVGSTYTDTNTYLNNPIFIGCQFDTTGLFNGYIDDLRVTLFGRYTANFTAPTAAFPVQ